MTLKVLPPPVEEPPVNTIITVDRAIAPVYPDWVKKVVHPDLEAQGLPKYDLANVEQWLHDDQKNGKWTKGDNIYHYLKKKDMLKTCLTLRDGEEIKKNGIAAFSKFFKGKAMFLWGSVVLSQGGALFVPYLFGYGVKIVIDWHWLVKGWYVNYPAGRFESESSGL